RAPRSRHRRRGTGFRGGRIRRRPHDVSDSRALPGGGGMPAEIIAIGTELTTGAKLDTNSQWLSLELSAVGIPVHYHTTVADDLAANVAVLRTAVARADV